MDGIEKDLRLIRPDALKTDAPLFWSTGRGTDVWEMFTAAITGDLPTIARLLDRDPSLVRAAYEYRPAIAFAVRHNQLAVVQLLLARGADPVGSGTPDTLLDIARDRGYAELQRLLESALAGAAGVATAGAAPRGGEVAAAIRDRDLAKMRSLLDASPDLLHAVDEGTNQPIHWAVMTRQLEAIDDLLARGADINARRSDGARPTQLTNGDYSYRGWRDVPPDTKATPDDVYRHLVARGAYVDIGMAAVKGDLAHVEALLDEDPTLVNRVSEYGSYYPGCGAPIKNAAATGHIDIVKLLLARGADPNLPEEGIAPRGHALYSAVANGHYEIAKLLLEHGAYPNVEVESSADTLSRAIGNGDRRMIDLLSSYGAARPVHLLANGNDLQTAAAVFAANPTLADDPGALGSASEAFTRLMLRYQPDLPKRATTVKTWELTELLFHHGMDPNRPNWLRITPLHTFAEHGRIEAAAIFLNHGADLHARDEEIRSTPLGWAAKFGQTRMVEFLLRRGAKPSLPDDPPWATPLAWATRRGHDDIVRLLTDYERSGTLPARRLADVESLARDFVEAYQSGDDAAFGRLMQVLPIKRSLTWDLPSRPERTARLRRGVRERLGTPLGDQAPSETLEIDEARLLIARAHGFATWDALANDIAQEERAR